MLNKIAVEINDTIITLLGSGTKLLIFYQLIKIIGVVIILLCIKRLIINRKVNMDEEYDEAGNF
ncbi:MAG: hypothetical protein CMF80_00250 [Candidatus Marinimicrobia bacterium]|nr:hypothetical protein [Candidatus Neomarinimicrobiota bacterium]|tara:strand:+ start:741 stop:932 length:192 start_codon:yes stop_codon:yes gene_type:complete